MSLKKKRGANYTPQETEKLLELVAQYPSIEDKRTGAIYLARKKEAWEKVCTAYNAVATSGVRSVEQLKISYDNKKQKARKALAEHNKSEYIQHHVTEEEVKEAIQHAKEDKGNITFPILKFVEWRSLMRSNIMGQHNKTGGGSWCPSVTDHDYKILNLVKDQVTPLPNTCDSAAVFFGDLTHESPEILLDEIIIDMPEDLFNEQNEGNNDLSKAKREQASTINIIPTPTRKNIRNLRTKKVVTPAQPRKQINYKQLYFKRKSQNALLERRKFYQDIRLRQKEHTFLLKEHQLRMQIMKEELEKK